MNTTQHTSTAHDLLGLADDAEPCAAAVEFAERMHNTFATADELRSIVDDASDHADDEQPSKLVALVDEYISEAEHQDGRGYWADNFDNLGEAVYDFLLYVANVNESY